MKEKDLRISNLKGLLIALVVFGHFIELQLDRFTPLFLIIYSFHMPLFVFISGLLAKRLGWRKILNLLAIYLIFQTFFEALLNYLGEGNGFPYIYSHPQFHLWYIISLAFWYTLALGITKLKPKPAGKALILTAILLIAAVSRLYTEQIEQWAITIYPDFTSYTLSYQRTLTFAPFFFAGFFMTINQWKQTVTRINPITAWALLALTITALTAYTTQQPQLESLFRGSFGQNRFDQINYPAAILIHYALIPWLAILIATITTTKQTILTKWGDRSLTIFLLHPIITFLFRTNEWGTTLTTAQALILYITATLAVTVILSNTAIVNATNRLTSPLKKRTTAKT